MEIGALFAHQGGWDEALLVAVPILVIVGVLVIAKRRVDRQVADREPVSDPTGPRDR